MVYSRTVACCTLRGYRSHHTFSPRSRSRLEQIRRVKSGKALGRKGKKKSTDVVGVLPAVVKDRIEICDWFVGRLTWTGDLDETSKAQ